MNLGLAVLVLLMRFFYRTKAVITVYCYTSSFHVVLCKKQSYWLVMKRDILFWVFITSKNQNEHSIWGLACSDCQNFILLGYICEGGTEIVFHNTCNRSADSALGKHWFLNLWKSRELEGISNTFLI